MMNRLAFDFGLAVLAGTNEDDEQEREREKSGLGSGVR